MTSEELAEEVVELVKRSTGRILGVGHDQYSFGESQAFERYTDEEMQQAILEEIEDTINHLVMLHIRVRRVSEEANRYATRQRNT